LTPYISSKLQNKVYSEKLSNKNWKVIKKSAIDLLTSTETYFRKITRQE
jgi:hypothetical protein